jgi:hypothetical protein
MRQLLLLLVVGWVITGCVTDPGADFQPRQCLQALNTTDHALGSPCLLPVWDSATNRQNRGGNGLLVQ